MLAVTFMCVSKVLDQLCLSLEAKSGISLVLRIHPLTGFMAVCAEAAEAFYSEPKNKSE